jgi:3-isopropylmalate dehydrogenase
MTFKILLLPGDGVGPEVIRIAEKVLQALKQRFQLKIETETALIGGAAIDAHGKPLPEKTLNMAKLSNSILLGAVGGPKWDPLPLEKRPEKGLLQLRSEFNLFANLRPAKLYSQLVQASSLKPQLISGLDMMIVRELVGGIYFGEPRGINKLAHHERQGINTLVYTEHEIERIAKVAFEIAKQRKRQVCSVDKANVLEVSVLWREVVNKVAKGYPDIKLSHMYVDNAAMQLVRSPLQFDVIVTDNMFGDILSDCAAMLTGSIGMLPSASMNEKHFGLYEPVHGSAPDIAGQNVVNPIATLLSVAMLLRYSMRSLEAASALEDAIAAVLNKGYRTKDIALPNEDVQSTEQMGQAVVDEILH